MSAPAAIGWSLVRRLSDERIGEVLGAVTSDPSIAFSLIVLHLGLEEGVPGPEVNAGPPDRRESAEAGALPSARRGDQ